MDTPQIPEGGPTPLPIIGRARELELFRAAFDRMLAGRRQLLLVAGEPGIGKTRCAEALAEIAEDQGALVIWGRCQEDAGAPPYWPWVQILRAYVDASSIDEVRLNMGPLAKDITALLPEMLEASLDPQPFQTVTSDSNSARFRTFDAIRHLLSQAAQQVPIVLVLEDLHWADPPSLLLLEFLSQQLLRSRLLIIGTYREADASGRTPLLSTLGGLGRDANVQRVHLTGLLPVAIAEVARQLCDVSLSDSALQLIYRQTDGNPLFAIELIRVLIDEGAGADMASMPAKIPAGVRETIGRRLSRLPEECNALLGIASVHGRQFVASEIAAATGKDLLDVLEILEPAVQAGIVQPEASAAGTYQFIHALIRETIYEDLPTVDRMHLHAGAGDALVSIYAAYLEPALARIAHHYHEAAAVGNDDKAVAFAFRAAESAVRLFAYEDALPHYEHVIQTLQSSGLTHDERLARAYVLKGSALRQLGQIQDSIAVLFEAVTRTRLSGNSELLIDLLMLLAFSTRHVEQQHLIPLLERSLIALPQVDLITRAKALATLAFAQRTSIDRGRLQCLVDEALDLASRSSDNTARCACYQLVVMALRGIPESLHRRLLLGQEYIALARSTGNAELLAEACHWQALNYFESGQLDELELLLQPYTSLSAAGFGLHAYQSRAHRVTLALLRGEWDGLEAQIEALLEIGTKSRRDDADGVYGAQMFTLNRDLGRLHALGPQIKSEINSSALSRMWQPGLMLLCAELDLMSEARAIFDRLAGQGCSAIPRDDMYMTCLVFCTETCFLLADADRAESLYQLLLPYTRQTANHPTAVCFGAADHYLALLASTANHPDLARAHFEAALTLNRAMRAWPCLARTLFSFGTFLVHQQSDADRRQGQQQLREAEVLARRLNMAQLALDVSAMLQPKNRSVAFPDELTDREVEVLRLIAIGRTNKDVSLVLAISLNTVATHVRNILNKTHCANRTEAAAYARRHGLADAQSDLTAI